MKWLDWILGRSKFNEGDDPVPMSEVRALYLKKTAGLWKSPTHRRYQFITRDPAFALLTLTQYQGLEFKYARFKAKPLIFGGLWPNCNHYAQKAASDILHGAEQESVQAQPFAGVIGYEPYRGGFHEDVVVMERSGELSLFNAQPRVNKWLPFEDEVEKIFYTFV